MQKLANQIQPALIPPRPSGIHPRNARMVQHPQFNQCDISQLQFPELPHCSTGPAGQTGPRQPTGARFPWIVNDTRAGLVGLLTHLRVSSTQALWTAFCLRVLWGRGVGGRLGGGGVLRSADLQPPSPLGPRTQGSPSSLPDPGVWAPSLLYPQDPGVHTPNPLLPRDSGEPEMGNRHTGGEDVQSAPPAHQAVSPGGGRQAGDLLM